MASTLSNAQQRFLSALQQQAPNGDAIDVERCGRFQTAIGLERRGIVTVRPCNRHGWVVSMAAPEQPAAAAGDGNKAKLRRLLAACLVKHFASKVASRAIGGQTLDAARIATNVAHCGRQFFSDGEEARIRQAVTAINEYAGTNYTKADIEAAQDAIED